MSDLEPTPRQLDEGGNKGDLPSTPVSIPFEEFQRTRMGIMQLPMGATITSIPKIEDLREIVMSVHATRPFERGRVRTQGNPELFIADYLRKVGFFGKISEISATRLPFDPSLFDSVAGEVDPDGSYTILTELGLSSTGRGKIGTLVVESSNAYVRGGVGAYDVHKNRVLKGEDGTSVLDRLMADSSVNWNAARVQGLRNTVSAGLPTLGKRR